jgi:hypothetical protein
MLWIVPQLAVGEEKLTCTAFDFVPPTETGKFVVLFAIGTRAYPPPDGSVTNPLLFDAFVARPTYKVGGGV